MRKDGGRFQVVGDRWSKNAVFLSIRNGIFVESTEVTSISNRQIGD